MNIEMKVEGGVIRGTLVRTPLRVTTHPGPGMVLLPVGCADAVEKYQQTYAYDSQWLPDMMQIQAAMAMLSVNENYAAVVRDIERQAKGSSQVMRWMLLNLRLIGEPYLADIEQLELPNGRIEWSLVGTSRSLVGTRLLKKGIWVPDESMYEEMESLARAFTVGRLELADEGRVLVRPYSSEECHGFSGRDEAVAWMQSRVERDFWTFTPQEQAAAMGQAAVDRARAALERINCLINCDTYTAVATLYGADGVRQEHQTEGLIGHEHAVEELHQLLEKIHPTAYPQPRMH